MKKKNEILQILQQQQQQQQQKQQQKQQHEMQLTSNIDAVGIPDGSKSSSKSSSNDSGSYHKRRGSRRNILNNTILQISEHEAKTIMELCSNDECYHDSSMSAPDVYTGSDGGIRAATRDGDISSNRIENSSRIQKVTKKIRNSRLSIFAVLLIIAISSLVCVYMFTRRYDSKNFEIEYIEYSTKVINAVLKNSEHRVDAIDSFSNYITNYAISTNQYWPNVTIPNFENRATYILNLPDVVSIGFLPFNRSVSNNTKQQHRDDFRWEEEYASSIQNQYHNWYLESINYQQEQGQVGNDDGVDDNGSIGAVEFLSKMSDNNSPITGGAIILPPDNMTLSSVLTTKSTVVSRAIDLSNSINNVSASTSIVAINEERRKSSLTLFLNRWTKKNDDIWEKEKQFKDNCGPISDLYTPIFDQQQQQYYYEDEDEYNYQNEEKGKNDDNFEEGSLMIASPSPKTKNNNDTHPSSLIGILISCIYWQVNFENIKAPENSNIDGSIMAILENTCNQTYAYKIHARSGKVDYIGPGDLHNKKYDKFMKTTGYGTLFATQKEHHYESSSSSNSSSSSSSSSGGNNNGNQQQCIYNMRFYPTKEMIYSYHTNTPIMLTIMVVIALAVTSLLFIIHNYFVERRQSMVMETAIKSTQVIRELFPEKVYRRLFNIDEASEDNDDYDHIDSKNEFFDEEYQTNKIDDQEVKSSPTGGTEKSRVLNSVRAKQGSSSYKPSLSVSSAASIIPHPSRGSSSAFSSSQVSSTPSNDTSTIANNNNNDIIADMHENCTVLFADIAGFTKWSSMREPIQVFHLLETIYGIFDKASKQRGVFKVETIGDCYLAVTGLPQPQGPTEHSVIMCKFALDMLVKFNQLTKSLSTMKGQAEEGEDDNTTKSGIDTTTITTAKDRENNNGDDHTKNLTLLHVLGGEDTLALKMRVGLHSGNVTAGVLRGDRARYQLFGDTVNTASRMESNGEPGMIHLSGETANILIKAGKRKWIRKRKDLIEAKGKGLLQTYWLIPQNASGGKFNHDGRGGVSRKNSSLGDLNELLDGNNQDGTDSSKSSSEKGERKNNNRQQHEDSRDNIHINNHNDDLPFDARISKEGNGNDNN